MTKRQLYLFTASLLAAYLLLHSAVSARHGTTNLYQLDDEIDNLKEEVKELRADRDDLENKLSGLEITIDEIEADKHFRRR